MYPLGLEPSPDWEPEIKKLMIELAELIDSPTRTSPSVTEQIVAASPHPYISLIIELNIHFYRNTTK
jgi:hypothetical protein